MSRRYRVHLNRFFGYYGAKNRLAAHYPAPQYNEVIEPFGGSAAYALRYFNHKVTINELDPVLFGIWSYLVRVKPREILKLRTDIRHVDELPKRTPQEAKDLIGFWFHQGAFPLKARSGFGNESERNGKRRSFSCWADDVRQRIADQVEHIRHWKIIHGTYADLGNRPATWFVDPPYQCDAGRTYRCNEVDFDFLGSWCKSRLGQTIVCEQLGADWLPFVPFKNIVGISGKRTTEVVWLSDQHKTEPKPKNKPAKKPTLKKKSKPKKQPKPKPKKKRQK